MEILKYCQLCVNVNETYKNIWAEDIVRFGGKFIDLNAYIR